MHILIIVMICAVLFVPSMILIAVIVQSPIGDVIEKVLPRYPRFLNRLWAFLGSYYWSDCPACGKMYGGHEHASNSFMDSWNGGRLVCWRCNDIAKEQNNEFMKNNPPPIYNF